LTKIVVELFFNLNPGISLFESLEKVGYVIQMLLLMGVAVNYETHKIIKYIKIDVKNTKKGQYSLKE